MPPPHAPTRIDARAWQALAAGAGIQPTEKLLLALSGGADSVLLLQLIAAAEPRPALRVLHVQHGLRGAHSEADERFCQALCEQLRVPYACAHVQLDAERGSLENQARRARYRALCREAETTGHATILTGHQRQDVLETLIWRWIRGSSPRGLRGPRLRMRLAGSTPGLQLSLVRPLLELGRDEIRSWLSEAGLGWREDLSNHDKRFTRNRLRLGFLPFWRSVGGAELIESLQRHASTIERLEQHLEQRGAHLLWSPEPNGVLSLSREQLLRLTPGIQRRALWRLITEALGAGPRGVLLDRILDQLQRDECARHTLAPGWTLALEPLSISLCPREPGQRR